MATFLKVGNSFFIVRASDLGRRNSVLVSGLRSYCRWAHRRPSRVITSELKTEVHREKLKRLVELGGRTEYLDGLQPGNLREGNRKYDALNEGEKEMHGERLQKSRSDGRSKSYKVHREEDQSVIKVAGQKTLPDSSSVSDKIVASAAKLGVPVFVKLQERDSKLSNIMLTVKASKKKKLREVVVLEGRRLIQDSVDAGFIPHMIFFSNINDLRDLRLPTSGVEIFKLPYKTLCLWSELSTCPGIMGIIKVPAPNEIKLSQGCVPITIICDNIRDPGNMGSILRTSAGVGCQKVILTRGCVDLWDTKVLRAASGAHFRVPIHKDVSWDSVVEQLGNECSVFLADNNLGERCVDTPSLVSGKEPAKSNGSEDLDICKETVINEGCTEPLDQEVLNVKEIPVLPYYAVDFTKQKSMVLVIGGETEGLSTNAFKLAHKMSGKRVIVPLNNNVESLNSGTALGILSFEIKRQLLQEGLCK